MTEFGTANDAVAICRAVMIGIVPDVRIMDITHQVTPFSIEEALFAFRFCVWRVGLDTWFIQISRLRCYFAVASAYFSGCFSNLSLQPAQQK